MSHDQYVMLLSTALISEFETFSHHELNLSEDDETATVSNDSYILISYILVPLARIIGSCNANNSSSSG